MTSEPYTNKEYQKDDLTVSWEPDKCMHSEHCWRELNDVFNPKSRPWIQLEGATKERIIAQVKRCPSGALGYKLSQEKEPESVSTDPPSISITAGGPIIIKGPVEINRTNGQKDRHDRMCALCRCGASANKPYCDGSHKSVGFNG